MNENRPQQIRPRRPSKAALLATIATVLAPRDSFGAKLPWRAPYLGYRTRSGSMNPGSAPRKFKQLATQAERDAWRAQFGDAQKVSHTGRVIR